MTHRRIHGTRNALGKLGRVHLRWALTVLCSSMLGQSYSLESRRGIIHRNNDPVCIQDCDKFYLEPDPTYFFTYLHNFDFYPYAEMHVEVTGARGSCGGCVVLNVISITVLPPEDVQESNGSFPQYLVLAQNYPNPFNPQTSIQYSLPRTQYVSLDIYDVFGQRVATLVRGVQAQGKHTEKWSASNQTGKGSGVFYYRLRTESATITRRMQLVR